MKLCVLTLTVYLAAASLPPPVTVNSQRGGQPPVVIAPGAVPQESPEPPPVVNELIATRDEVVRGPDTLSESRPLNANARASHNVDDMQAEFPGINGRTVVAAVFDDGLVRRSHKEFRVVLDDPETSRVKFRVPATTGFTKHATHVAGTMAAAGNVHAHIKGMAPALATIYSESFVGDMETLARIAPMIKISNHSYGPLSGWELDVRRRPPRWIWCGDESKDAAEDAKFGKYTAKESELDKIIFQHKTLLSFVAAGNDRDDGPPAERQPVDHYVCSDRQPDGTINTVLAEGVTRKVDGFDAGGLDTVSGLCMAKNAICIGAIGDTEPLESGSTIGAVEVYSGWGPTDDGRVKPDLVANGHNLISTSSTDDEAIVTDIGTSMASPTAAGIAALLVQLYREKRGSDPFASVIKAILIHTARDAGEPGPDKPGEPGPDPVFGWGSVDALRAARVIARTNAHLIQHLAVSENNPVRQMRLLAAATGDPIKVTLVWTDPPSQDLRTGLDDPAPMLVNDLDVKLIAPDGQRYFPYTLDPANPHAQARRNKENRVDNVEVIEGVGSLPGTWIVEVTAHNLKAGPQQDFAIVISGLREP